MFNGWTGDILLGLQTINELLSAAIAITAFSLFIYSLTFNLRDRVARSFAIILLCVIIIFTTDSLQNKDIPAWGSELLLQIQWLGIVYLPAAYLHLSDALLVKAGRPSRGRRRAAIRLTYLISSGFLVLLGTGQLLGPLVPEGQPAPHSLRTLWTEIFTVYYVVIMLLAWLNFGRAYVRMLTRSGRRRMVYLMAGATAPALGCYPFLLYGSSVASHFPILFWGIVVLINVLVGGLIVVMAYAVAFFGVSWPDRVVKSRLFKWIMRGPVTASVALGLMTMVRRAGEMLGTPYTALVPLTMIVTVLSLEHIITLVSPLWERWIFYGGDRKEIAIMQNIEERLLTRGDLQQFLEAILAAVRDHMQSSSVFITALDRDELSLVVVAGNNKLIDQAELSGAIRVVDTENGDSREYVWGDYWVLPLRQRKREADTDEVPPLLGLMGIAKISDVPIDQEQRNALWLLAERAAFALEDRKLQLTIFRSLEYLRPQMEVIQQLRAAGRFDSRENIIKDPLPPSVDIIAWVKDALNHYWGGPKLMENPLMRLQVFQKLLTEYEDNPPNTLRALLRKAIDQTRPEGERRFTSDWILFNILELKFVEGHKVREVAARLAISEADLYRKQKIAVESVAQSIIEMEAELQVNR